MQKQIDVDCPDRSIKRGDKLYWNDETKRYVTTTPTDFGEAGEAQEHIAAADMTSETRVRIKKAGA